MVPIIFIVALLIAAGLILVGYTQKQKEAIFFGGLVLIILGITTITERVQYQTGTLTNTTTTYNYLTNYECQQYLTENSTCCCTFLSSTDAQEQQSIVYGDVGATTGTIFGTVLLILGFYFTLIAFFLKD